jgi:hypothetical protein
MFMLDDARNSNETCLTNTQTSKRQAVGKRGHSTYVANGNGRPGS